MSPAELMARALAAPPDSAERILYAAAAFDSLTGGDAVLVGGGAQVTHTGVGRLTDVDVVVAIGEDDERRLAAAGFTKVGRHWIFEGEADTIAIEVPAAGLTVEEDFEEVELDGAVVRVITATDLMMDRVLQATDGSSVTRNEAEQLAIAASDRIDWDTLQQRAARMAATSRFLHVLPALVAEMRSIASRGGS